MAGNLKRFDFNKVYQKEIITFLITFSVWSAFWIGMTYLAVVDGDTPENLWGTPMKVLFVFLFLIGIWIAISVARGKLKYLPCPYCKRMVKVVTAWKCDHCDHQHLLSRRIDRPCTDCHSKLNSVICDYCEKEISIW